MEGNAHRFGEQIREVVGIQLQIGRQKVIGDARLLGTHLNITHIG
jgi:hypothetical protein